MSKRTALVYLLLIILVGVALRSYHLTARSLWFDEAFSWRLIQFPWTDMLARAAADVHPPLYYMALKSWSIVFGSSLLALRSFSVVAAAGTIAAAYLFVSSAIKLRPAGVLVAALVALSGWQIQFAWEARMYTLGTLLALLSSWALLRAVRSEPQKFSWWLLYALFASAFGYIHYYAIFTITAQALFVVGYIARGTGGRVGEIIHARRVWYAMGAAVITLGLWLPWLPTFIEQNKQVQASYWIPALGGWSIPDTFYRMFIPTAGIPTHLGIGWIALALVPLLGCVGGLVVLARYRRRTNTTTDAQWLIVAAATVPFLLSIGISLVSQSLYQDRFFMFAHLFLLITLAILLIRLPWVWLRAVAMSVVLLAFVGAHVQFWRELDILNRPGVSAAAAQVYADTKTPRPVVVSSPFIYFAVLQYAVEEYQVLNTPHLYSESGTLQHFAGGPILIEDDVVGPGVFDTDTQALWIIDTTGFGGSPLMPPAPWHKDITSTYPEVFSHQGTVTATRYIK